MIKVFKGLAASLALLISATAYAAPPADPAKFQAWAKSFLASLHPQSGLVTIPEAKAKLDIPQAYIFYGKADAKRILHEAWNNPPAPDTLGILMPAKTTPFSPDGWAAVITYQEDGYVSDIDAKKTDYTKLMTDLKQGAEDYNPERKKQGYQPLHILGWAKPPAYDEQQHKMYWAKLLRVEGNTSDELNYDIRVLGRKGVLSMNFLAAPSQLKEIEQAAPAVLAMTSFEAGARYEDYNGTTDKVAAYGLAGLVAGGVIAKKTGLLALLLIFGKKGIVVIVAAAAALKAKFSRKKADPGPVEDA